MKKSSVLHPTVSHIACEAQSGAVLTVVANELAFLPRPTLIPPLQATETHFAVCIESDKSDGQKYLLTGATRTDICVGRKIWILYFPQNGKLLCTLEIKIPNRMPSNCTMGQENTLINLESQLHEPSTFILNELSSRNIFESERTEENADYADIIDSADCQLLERTCFRVTKVLRNGFEIETIEGGFRVAALKKSRETLGLDSTLYLHAYNGDAVSEIENEKNCVFRFMFLPQTSDSSKLNSVPNQAKAQNVPQYGASGCQTPQNILASPVALLANGNCDVRIQTRKLRGSIISRKKTKFKTELNASRTTQVTGLGLPHFNFLSIDHTETERLLACNAQDAAQIEIQNLSRPLELSSVPADEKYILVKLNDCGFLTCLSTSKSCTACACFESVATVSSIWIFRQQPESPISFSLRSAMTQKYLTMSKRNICSKLFGPRPRTLVPIASEISSKREILTFRIPPSLPAAQQQQQMLFRPPVKPPVALTTAIICASTLGATAAMTNIALNIRRQQNQDSQQASTFAHPQPEPQPPISSKPSGREFEFENLNTVDAGVFDGLDSPLDVGELDVVIDDVEINFDGLAF